MQPNKRKKKKKQKQDVARNPIEFESVQPSNTKRFMEILYNFLLRLRYEARATRETQHKHSLCLISHLQATEVVQSYLAFVRRAIS